MTLEEICKQPDLPMESGIPESTVTDEACGLPDWLLCQTRMNSHYEWLKVLLFAAGALHRHHPHKRYIYSVLKKNAAYYLLWIEWMPPVMQHQVRMLFEFVMEFIPYLI